MEVAVSPAIVHDIFKQLRQQNAVQRDAFADVVEDYMGAVQRSRELQVGCQSSTLYRLNVTAVQ